MRKQGKRFKTHNFNTNPLVALTAEEHLMIINPTHVSLLAFMENRATATDWYNVTFRIHMAMTAAKLCGYTDETVAQLKQVHDMLLQVERESCEVGHKSWLMTAQEVQLLNAGIEASDEIQYSAKRLFIHKAAVTSKKVMAQYV